MSFTLGGRQVRVDVGHLAFLLAVAGWCVWFLLDARAASTNVQNLLLIQPAVILAQILVVVIARSTVHLGPADAPDDAPAAPPADTPATLATAAAGEKPKLSPAEDRREVLRVFGFMALLAAYLAVIPTLGLDIATFLFVSACLLAQGERRLLMVVGVPLVFSAIMVFGFKALLPIPIPTFFG